MSGGYRVTAPQFIAPATIEVYAGPYILPEGGTLTEADTTALLDEFNVKASTRHVRASRKKDAQSTKARELTLHGDPRTIEAATISAFEKLAVNGLIKGRKTKFDQDQLRQAAQRDAREAKLGNRANDASEPAQWGRTQFDNQADGQCDGTVAWSPWAADWNSSTWNTMQSDHRQTNLATLWLTEPTKQSWTVTCPGRTFSILSF